MPGMTTTQTYTIRTGVTREQAQAWLAHLPAELEIIDRWEDRAQRTAAKARLMAQKRAMEEFLK